MSYKTYSYGSVKRSTHTFLARSGWEQDCQNWRDRNTDVGMLKDVYDGKIWKTFRYHDGSLYFSHHLRFLRENVVLVSIVSGMSNKPQTNTFLETLGKESEVAWNDGFILKYC